MTLAIFYNRRILLIICTCSHSKGAFMTSIQTPFSQPLVLRPKLSELSLTAIGVFLIKLVYLPLTWYFQKKASLTYMHGIHWWTVHQKLKKNPGMMLKSTIAYRHAKSWVHFGIYLEYLATPWEKIETIPWEEVYTPDSELMAWEKQNTTNMPAYF